MHRSARFGGLVLLCATLAACSSDGDCPEGQVRCGDACVDTATSALHCGSCSHACPAPRGGLAACTQGVCGGACDDGRPLCEDACVDFGTDPDHCGGCGRACPRPEGGSASCVASSCGASCPPGVTACGLDCVDTTTDLAHCGGCARACSPPEGGTASCAAGGCERTCPAGRTLCGDACVDVTTDLAHCGACDGSCTPPTGGAARCVASTCVPECPRGLAQCGDTCRNLFSDITNCGACGVVCEAPPGGSAACLQRTCRKVCPDGLTLCGGRCVDLANDPQHCGACDAECAPPPGGLAACVQGDCSGRCSLGTEFCDGACRNHREDPAHCGACGRACPVPAGGEALCVEGACEERCGASLLSCDLACVDPTSDPAHCGGCGIACSAPSGGATRCEEARCVDVCPAPLLSCGGTCVALDDDDLHCGACHFACGGAMRCEAGRCVPRVPELVGVAPARAWTGGSAVLLASGRNFVRPLEASLVRGDERVSLDETLSSTAQLRARVPSGLAAGSWDLEVRTAGGAARLPAALTLSDAPVRLELLDVGRGDAMVVSDPSGGVLVVDGGPAGSGAPLRALLNGRRPSWVVATTYAPEHLDGLVELLRGPDRRAGTSDDVVPQVALVDHGDNHACSTPACVEYLELRGRLDARGLVRTARPGDVLELGVVRATVLSSSGEVLGRGRIPTARPREHGVSLLLEAAGLRLLSTADLPAGALTGCASSEGLAAVEQAVARAAGRVDVWKVGGHGDCSSGDAASLGTMLPALVVATPGDAACEPSTRLVRSLEHLGGRLALTTPGRFTAGAACPSLASAPSVGPVVLEVAPDGTRRLLVGGVAQPVPQAPSLWREPALDAEAWSEEGASPLESPTRGADTTAALVLRLLQEPNGARVALLPWDAATDVAIAAFEARAPVAQEVATRQEVVGDRLIVTPVEPLAPGAPYALLVPAAITNAETTRVLTYTTATTRATARRIVDWSAHVTVPANTERIDLVFDGPLAPPPAGSVFLEDAADASDVVHPVLESAPPLLRLRLPAASRTVDGVACGPLCPGRTYAVRTTAGLTGADGTPALVPSERTLRVASCAYEGAANLAMTVTHLAGAVRFDASSDAAVSMWVEVAPEDEFDDACAPSPAGPGARCRGGWATSSCASSVGTCGAAPNGCSASTRVGLVASGRHRWRARGSDRAGRPLPVVEGAFDADVPVGPLLAVTELHPADESSVPPFLELANVGDAPVPLAGLTLRRANEELPLTPVGAVDELGPGARALVVADEAALAEFALAGRPVVLVAGRAPVVRVDGTVPETVVLRDGAPLARSGPHRACSAGASVEREPPGLAPAVGWCAWPSPGAAPSVSP